MDPRTGRNPRPKKPTPAPQTSKGQPKPPKLKSVTLLVEWGYEIHTLEVSAGRWKRIVAGDNLTIKGKPYSYEGERFDCWWDFNGHEGPGSLIVSYSGGGDGYVGTWSDALNEEHFG